MPQSSAPPLAEMWAPRFRRPVLGLGHGVPEWPAALPDAQLLLGWPLANGAWRFDALPGQASTPELPAGARFFRVTTAAVPVRLAFAGLVREDGFSWDLLLPINVAIFDGPKFLSGVALGLMSERTPLSCAMLESWLASRLEVVVRDSPARQYTVEQLQRENVLPAPWWERQLNEALRPYGLQVRIVENPQWVSADHQRAVDAQQRAQDMAAVAETRRRETEAQKAAALQDAQYEAQQLRIAADISMAQQERAAVATRLEMEHRKAVLQSQMELVQCRRQAELAALEHEKNVARLKQDIGAERKIDARQEDIRQNGAAAVAEMGTNLEALQGLFQHDQRLLAEVIAGGARAQAAFDALIFRHDQPPALLEALGYNIDRQKLVWNCRERARQDGDVVKLIKPEAPTRDIGLNEYKGVAIGDSLAFRATSRRAGYLTLLNVGTSGRTWLHVPSPLCAVKASKIRADVTYVIPGEPLFPWPHDYTEEGPGGRFEFMVAIVSDEPLVEQGMLERATATAPLAAVDAGEFWTILERQGARTWTAGVLAFMVDQ